MISINFEKNIKQTERRNNKMKKSLNYLIELFRQRKEKLLFPTIRKNSTEEISNVAINEDIMKTVGRNFIEANYPTYNIQYQEKAVNLQPYATETVIKNLIPKAFNRKKTNFDNYSYRIHDMEFKKISFNKVLANVSITERIYGQVGLKKIVKYKLVFNEENKVYSYFMEISLRK